MMTRVLQGIMRGRARPDPYLALGLVLLVAVGAFLAWSPEANDAPRATPLDVGLLDDAKVEVGKRAPDFGLVDARDGVTVRRLSDYRGSTVVLNWYASWCGPCRRELPDFEEAFQALGPNVVVLAVNLRESPSAATGILDDTGATFPAVLDSDGDVAARFGVRGMPTTFFIDGDGIVRMAGAGTITREQLKAELLALGHSY
ncbi:MAG: TlpA family protein disulfide reductase [Dehalococcoidia bacterium]